MAEGSNRKHIEAVLFDLDGTLIDTWEDITLSVNNTLGGFGLPSRTPEEVRSFIGDGARELIERSLGDAATEALVEEGVKRFKEHYFAHCTEHARLFDGVRETLPYFSRLPMAVVTNKPFVPSVSLLKSTRIDHFFKEVLGGDSLPVRKPSPDPLLEAARRLGASPAKTLMIGDSNGDIQAGKAAGMSTCGVTFGYRPEQEIRTAQPDFVVASFPDLKNLLVNGRR